MNNSVSGFPRWPWGRFFVLGAVCGVILTACGEEPPAGESASPPQVQDQDQDQDQLVARVFDRDISVEDYRRQLERVPPRLRAQTEPRRYVQAIIDEELLVREADRQGLQRSAEMQRARQKEARILTLRQLYQMEGIKRPEPTEEELRAYFADSPYNRRVRFSLLMVRDVAKIPALRRALDEGADFETLSLKHSQDSRILERDADMGYHRWGETMPSHEALTAKAFTMEVGQIAGPLAVADGHFLIKITDVHPVSFEQEADTVQRLYLQEAIAEQLHQYYERLAARYRLELDTAGLKALADSWDDSSAVDGTLLLASYGDEGAEINIDQGRRLLRGSGRQWGANTDSLRRHLVQQVSRDLLAPQEIGRLGLMQSEFISLQWQKSRRKFLVNALRRQIAAQVPPANENVLRLFFEENPERYAEKAQIEVRRLPVGDAEAGRRLVQSLRDGTAAAETQAGFVSLTYDAAAAEGDNPVSRALRAEAGTYHGPFATDTGYIVLHVVKHIPGRSPAYQEVRDRVVEDFEADRADQRFQEFLRSLRQRDAAQIDIDELALSRLQNQDGIGRSEVGESSYE
jgi:parvulin-like peptidyl-prolyl isomerase